MFTDMVGFTSLTQHDEPLALRLLEEHRQLVRPLVAAHGGREVKTIGDAFMVEFQSALEAAQCGVEIQRTFFDRNQRPGTQRIDLRIGIHVGEVVPQAGDVFGETVNLASRIVPMAEPGGVCISRAVFDQVRAKLPLSYTQLGPASLKGVHLPVHLYRIEVPWRVLPIPREPVETISFTRWDSGVRETPLVDRIEEVDRLHEFADSTAQGKGEALFLSGEAGIGKSRLARETQSYAVLRGVRTLTAVCMEVHGGVPYGPWLQLLRRVVREEPGDNLLRLCGPFAGDLCKIVPEITEKTGPLAQLPPGDPAQERLRFFDVVTEFFLALAKDQPLLLLFEDLGWADPGSLQLLHHVIRNLGRVPVGILGTFRPVEISGGTPLGRFLGELNRDRLLQSVSLLGMGLPSVAQLAHGILGEEGIAASFQELVYRKTGGNPFFVEEILQEVIRGGRLVRTPKGWDLKTEGGISFPPTVRNILEERLHGLEPDTLAILRIAAVMGQEFDLGVLERTVDQNTEELSDRLDAVLRAGLLTEERRKGDRTVYVFRDRQLREVIYDDLSLVRRRSHHLKTARAIESEFADSLEDHLDELAHHFLEGSDPQKSLDYALRAAERAFQVHAHEAAANHYGVALELLESHPDPGLRRKVLERLGSAGLALGETDRAVQCWKDLAQSYEASSAPIPAGDVYRRIAMAFWESGNDASSFFRYCETALQILRAQPPSAELARLLSEVASGYFWFGRAAEGRRMCEEAVRLATDLGQIEIQAAAHLNLAATSGIANIESARTHFARWKELRGVDRPEDHLSLRFNECLQVAAIQEGLSGDGRTGLRWYDAMIQRSHEARFFSQEAIGRYMAAGTGDVERMRRECDAILMLHEKFGIPLIDVIEQRLAWRRFYDGDFEGAFDTYATAAGQTARNAPEYLGLWLHSHDMGAMLMDLGRNEEALDLLQRSKESAERNNFPLCLTFMVLDTFLRLLQVSLKLGREQTASTTFRELIEILSPLRHDLAGAIGAWAEALWAAHQRDWGSALGHFRRSVELWKRLDDRLNIARTLRDLATVYQQRGEMAEARAALGEVVILFDEMGALRHADIVRSELQLLTSEG